MRYILTLLILIPAIASAGTLTLRDAISMGLKNSFDIQMEKVNTDIRKKQTTEQESKFDPVFKASAGTGTDTEPTVYSPYNLDYLRQKTYSASAALTKMHRNGLQGELEVKAERTDTNNPYLELDPTYTTMVLMNLKQPLLKNYGDDVNTAGIRKAGIAYKQAEFDLYSKMVNKTADIETAYYSLAEAKEILTLAMRSQKLAESLLASDRKRFAAGIVPVTEVQEAQTAVAGRKEQVIAAKSGVQTAQNTLENLIQPSMDLSQAEPEKLRVKKADTDTNKVYKTALEMRPDLEKQKLELKKQDITIKYMKNQELPELDLVGTLGVSGLSGEERVPNRFDGSYYDSVTDMAGGSGYKAFVGLQYTFPVGNRGAKARTSAAVSGRLRHVYAIKKMEQDIKTQVKNAVTLLTTSKERYEVSNTFIDLSEKTLSQEMKKLKEGLSDTFRILKFQNDVIEAKMRAVKALYDYNRGLAMLYRSEGTNLDRYGFKIGESR